ncbi:MAG: DUF1572 domain-containing protein [Acidobacteria bacterium]|nr:DUF1572 domain-containing protein [Acidobacteriota bacterium]MCA1643734.1 DUF1572 domain-containing protein [Acidobacteriota bacterium]
MNEELANDYLQDALKVFRNYKKLGDGAIRQLSDEEMFRALDAEMNSVALNAKHMAGNMRSRWTDFLTTDGEKPDRDRDSEFVIDGGTTREDVLRWWEEGWRTVFAALEPLRAEDLSREVTIRGEPHTVLMAINRQLAHYAYHTGQIVFLAKHFKSDAWQSLSIPRNRSAQFNRSMAERGTK